MVGGDIPLIIQFRIPQAVAKSRPRFTKSGRVFTPKKTSDAELAICNAYKGECIRRFGTVIKAPEHVEVMVAVTFTTPSPKARPKWVPKAIWQLGEVPFTTKPDIDNLVKTVFDALNTVAWEDDAQVVELHGYKLHRKRGGPTKTVCTVVWESDDEQESSKEAEDTESDK